MQIKPDPNTNQRMLSYEMAEYGDDDDESLVAYLYCIIIMAILFNYIKHHILMEHFPVAIYYSIFEGG